MSEPTALTLNYEPVIIKQYLETNSIQVKIDGPSNRTAGNTI